MAVPSYFAPSLEEERAAVAASFRVRFPTKAHDRDSFFGKQSRTLAMSLLGFMRRLVAAARDQVPGYDNSTAGAAAWGSAAGIPSNNPANRYGPNIAKPASGGVATATGSPGSPIADGTLLVDGTGQTTFATSGAVTVGAGGTISVAIIAVTPGTAGNVEAGGVLQFVTAPAGVAPQVQLTTGLGGGLEDEARTSVIERTLTNLRRPKRGGSAADFRRWCENYLTPQGIPGGLVARCCEYPLRGGVGTTHSVIIGGGNEKERLLSAQVAADVAAYVESVRPVTSKHLVLLPDMSRPGLSVITSVQPNPARKYQFDTAPFFLNVASVTDATHIVVDQNIATAISPPGLVQLRQAIDAGRKPRMQIQSQNQVLPIIVRAVAYTNAANSTITLEAAPSAPLVALDRVRAGSDVVLPIAIALRAFVNSLLPSRQSGYADAFDGWSDTLGVGAIEGIAMGTTDPNDPKAKLIINIRGTTINGASADVFARDVIVPPTGTPELLYLANGGIVILPLT